MKKHIDRIDVLRGMAILLVFFYHAQVALFPDFRTGQGLLSQFLRNLPSAYGGTGVQLFLIISGFLIHYSQLESGLTFSTRKFIWRRFWRIYPPYLFFLFVFYFLKETVSVPDMLMHVTMTYNLSDRTIFQINPSFWSLALEWQLYLLYPVYRFLSHKMGRDRVLFGISVLTVIFIMIQYWCKIDSAAYDFNALKYWIIWLSGALLAEYYHFGKRLVDISGIQLIMILTFLIFLTKIQILSNLYFYLFSLFYLLLMDWFLIADINIQKWYFKILIYVGIVSYSLYLFHQPFLWESINSIRFGFYSFLLTIPAVLIIYIVIATLSHRLLELPSVSLGKRIIKGHKD